jgi:hypothetical protein
MAGSYQKGGVSRAAATAAQAAHPGVADGLEPRANLAPGDLPARDEAFLTKLEADLRWPLLPKDPRPPGKVPESEEWAWRPCSP